MKKNITIDALWKAYNKKQREINGESNITLIAADFLKNSNFVFDTIEEFSAFNEKLQGYPTNTEKREFVEKFFKENKKARNKTKRNTPAEEKPDEEEQVEKPKQEDKPKKEPKKPRERKLTTPTGVSLNDVAKQMEKTPDELKGDDKPKEDEKKKPERKPRKVTDKIKKEALSSTLGSAVADVAAEKVLGEKSEALKKKEEDTATKMVDAEPVKPSPVNETKKRIKNNILTKKDTKKTRGAPPPAPPKKEGEQLNKSALGQLVSDAIDDAEINEKIEFYSEQMLSKIEGMADQVDDIHERLSVKDITIKEGTPEAQTYRYDPLAPQGMQVKQLSEKTGKSLTSNAPADDAKAVLQKASLLGSRSLEAKGPQFEEPKVERIPEAASEKEISNLKENIKKEKQQLETVVEEDEVPLDGSSEDIISSIEDNALFVGEIVQEEAAKTRLEIGNKVEESALFLGEILQEELARAKEEKSKEPKKKKALKDDEDDGIPTLKEFVTPTKKGVKKSIVDSTLGKSKLGDVVRKEFDLNEKKSSSGGDAPKRRGRKKKSEKEEENIPTLKEFVTPTKSGVRDELIKGVFGNTMFTKVLLKHYKKKDKEKEEAEKDKQEIKPEDSLLPESVKKENEPGEGTPENKTENPQTEPPIKSEDLEKGGDKAATEAEKESTFEEQTIQKLNLILQSLNQEKDAETNEDKSNRVEKEKQDAEKKSEELTKEQEESNKEKNEASSEPKKKKGGRQPKKKVDDALKKLKRGEKPKPPLTEEASTASKAGEAAEAVEGEAAGAAKGLATAGEGAAVAGEGAALAGEAAVGAEAATAAAGVAGAGLEVAGAGAMAALAEVALPVLAVGAAGYGLYKLGSWLFGNDDDKVKDVAAPPQNATSASESGDVNNINNTNKNYSIQTDNSNNSKSVQPSMESKTANVEAEQTHKSLAKAVETKIEDNNIDDKEPTHVVTKPVVINNTTMKQQPTPRPNVIVRNMDPTVATYHSSIFDHPVIHPGIYTQ